jgi:beta-lactamase class A
MINYKQWVKILIGLLLLPLSSVHAANLSDKLFRNLEQQYHRRIGISAIDKNNHFLITFNAYTPFPMCSTAKVMTVAGILKTSMSEKNLLAKPIIFTKQSLDAAGFTPITEKYLTTGMSIGQLCKAAIAYSDNAAMNLLMQELGGPKAVTQFARSMGDEHFNLVRWEPELNSAIPGDLRDATTPFSMMSSLDKLVLGHVLEAAQKNLLRQWLINNTTGNLKIRATVPNNWIVADKTGAGAYATSNDIAIIWPPHCKPLVMTIYTTGTKAQLAEQPQLIKKIAQQVISEFQLRDACLRPNKDKV